ncbi:MAG: Bifunctional protein FolD protein [Alphaproteobacteria bacterium MarineAlpha3_Bin5]|nr:MAG: Bifunctional protein FolD protein [Alphaproteobacteria bacterium MarineAlpha3_Bin5]
MSKAQIIDGKLFAARIRDEVAGRVADIKALHQIVPTLAVVLVGEDPASQVYVRNKGKQCKESGMRSIEHKLPAETTEQDLLTLVNDLNSDSNVHGVLVQLPLPIHINANRILTDIDPNKDVDGFHVNNVGKLWAGHETLVPCTPFGCLLLLRDVLGDLSGKRAVVLGRSNIVGKPMAALLLAENCTVTIAHSKTMDLTKQSREADILIAAVGKPEMVSSDWIKPGATVIDVGINRVAASDEEERKTKIVGDVMFSDAMNVAGAITPVPGGVGPMTIACLLKNTLVAMCRQHGITSPGI